MSFEDRRSAVRPKATRDYVERAPLQPLSALHPCPCCRRGSSARMQTSSVMRWHATACRWSFAESTHSRHDNEDRARADGVRIDCERATAAHDSRVREENLRQRALPRRSLGFDLRTHRLQFDRNQCLGDKISVCITEKSASQCYATVQSARFMNSKKSKRRQKKQKCSL